MTREEAIEYLNTLYMALAVFPNQQISLGNVDEMKESVSMAIKALEQEPCEDAQTSLTTKNALAVDCVSRKEVERLVYRFLGKNTDENIAFYEHFLDLPSVTPQEHIFNKIRTEIIQLIQNGVLKIESGNEALFDIIDKYRAEREE